MTFTVRDLCDAVARAFEVVFPDEIWVEGAISGLTRSGNGHVYLDLIDPTDGVGSSVRNVVPVALFASNRQRVNAILRRSGAGRMADGMEIRVFGRLNYYPPQGRVQLVMSAIDPTYTLGRMAQARAALLDALGAEGLLGANALVELPVLPLRIGLVTSDGSAAHADVSHQLAASGYRFDVILFDSRVQGVDAVPGLCGAISAAGRADVDVVVVVRGGGARSDLAAFDHEQVARAIATCPRPVVVGVGHEIDRSVADEVAHTSAKTPTAAAAFLVDAVRSFDRRVEQVAEALARRASDRLDRARADLAGDSRRLVQAAERSLERGAASLTLVTERLGAGAGRAGERACEVLDRADVHLRALDPAAALERGWSITHTADGGLVRDHTRLAIGQMLVTTLASGTVTSNVTALSAPTAAVDTDPTEDP